MSDAALRSRLIRLASEHPSGSAERKALLDVLKSAGSFGLNQMRDGDQKTISTDGIYAHV